jgi:hypothetical protein
MIKCNILLRTCDKVESSHKAKRPFSLNKLQTIKVCFYSLYESVQDFDCKITIIGDDLSDGLLRFFANFDNVVVDNEKLGSAAKSLQKQIELAEKIPDNEWIYMLEDDYLHTNYAFKYLDEFITNKEKYLQSSGKKKNYFNRIIGNLADKPLIIHTPDYPDRYNPPWLRHSFIFLSKYCHWRQISNTTHTFMLEGKTLKKYLKYIKLSAVGPSDSKLSEKVYGRLFLFNKALCISPIKGLSTHMTENVMTPLIDWETITNNIILDMQDKNLW